MCDECQDDTRGVSGRYGSVEHWGGSGGIVTYRVTCTWMHGCMKADDGDAQVQMLGCMSGVEWATAVGGGLSGRGKCMEMGNPDVFSAMCNSIPLLQTYSQGVLSSGVGVVVRTEDRSALVNERWGWFLEFTQVVHGMQSGTGMGSAYLAQHRV